MEKRRLEISSITPLPQDLLLPDRGGSNPPLKGLIGEIRRGRMGGRQQGLHQVHILARSTAGSATPELPRIQKQQVCSSARIGRGAKVHSDRNSQHLRHDANSSEHPFLHRLSGPPSLAGVSNGNSTPFRRPPFRRRGRRGRRGHARRFAPAALASTPFG